MRKRNVHRLAVLMSLLTWLSMSVSISAMAEVINCPNCDLEGKDYSGQTLSNSNFAGANLTNANFKNADLEGVNFQGANLTGANFTSATLSSDPSDTSVPSMFQSSNLSGATFTKATLNAADFQYTSMSCTDFSRVDTNNAVFGYLLDINDTADCQTTFAKSKISCELAIHRAALDFTDTELPSCDFDISAAAPVELKHTVADDGLNTVSMERVRSLPYAKKENAEVTSGSTQTVFVNTDGADFTGCGTVYSSACKTIQYGASQCGSADCLVAVAYGTFTPTTAISPAKGAITIAGGYVNGSQNSAYQSRVMAPAGGSAFLLQVADSGLSLENLLVQGADGLTSASSPAVLASSTAVTLSFVSVTAGKGGAGTASTPGAVGAGGVKGSAGSGSGTGGAGGKSSCNAAGGTGGHTKSITGGSGIDWFQCKYHCETSWFNGGSGMPGGTGNYASGSVLSKGNSLACYACPDGRGSMPKSAGTGSIGSNGGCGAGGVASTNTAGSMTAAGAWSPSTGGNGSAGLSGGGGGGGGPGGSCGYANCLCSYSTYAGGAGGGGGSGGCGATPGTGGGMGWASLGIVLAASTVTFSGTKNVITAMSGGAGAQGGTGAGGGVKGDGGGGQGYSNVCNDGGASGAAGGPGGYGGASGGGAGGNGGASINIALVGAGAAITGTPVYYQGTSGTPGAAGGAGVTLHNCTASSATAGTNGLVANTHTF